MYSFLQRTKTTKLDQQIYWFPGEQLTFLLLQKFFIGYRRFFVIVVVDNLKYIFFWHIINCFA